MQLSSQDLIAAGRQLEVPFEVSLKFDEQLQTGKCVQLLRLVPERRVVVEMLIGEQVYLGKIFLGSGKSKYLLRERSGIEALQQAGISTALIQGVGSLDDFNGEILLLDFLPDVKHLSERITEKAYLDSAIEMMARMHEKGLIHQDCHLDNFLISNEKLFLVDGDAVHQEANLSKVKAMENLALFSVQLPLMLNGGLPKLFSQYCTRRGWAFENDLPLFQADVQKQRENRQRRFLKKVFRDCTQFRVIKTWARYVAMDRQAESPELNALVENPDKYIKAGKLLKDGNSATVALIELEDKAFVVKRYNIKSFGHRLSRFWRASRAWLSWHNAQLLQFYGIGTPKPLALVECRFGPLRGKAYFISEYLGGEDALTYSKRVATETSSLAVLAEQFAGLFRTMRLLRLSHGDFKATNFLLDGGVLSVIDLDSMMLHTEQGAFQKALLKDQRRFMKNWEFNPMVESVMCNALDGFKFQ